MVHLTLAGISKHLTQDVIGEIFKLKYGDDEYVNSLEVSRAAPAGEGLLSAVYRITVRGNEKCTSFIVKGLITDPILRKSIDGPKFFARESLFFSEVLPALIDLQKSTGATEMLQNYVPRCYGTHIDGFEDYILMEDLCMSGCRSMGVVPAKRERNMTLTALAHLHATSIALRVKRPDEFARIQSSLPEIYYTDSHRGWYTAYLQKAIELDKEVINEYEDPSSVYYKKFYELIDGDLYGKIISLVSSSGNHPVIAHGDAWCPNFLCSKEKAVMIDYQLIRCASPATDLSVFAILCCSLGSANKDFLDAIDVYYASIQYFLEDMGLSPNQVFTRRDLDKELQTYGKFGLMVALTTIPLIYSERCDVLQSFEDKFVGVEKVPLVDLWQLSPLKTDEERMGLVNALRVAVDVGLL